MINAHDRLTAYLQSTGWLPPSEAGPAGGLWRLPGSELLLPVPHELVNEGLDWQRIVERLADIEGVAEDDIAARLEGRLVDVANIRAANDIVIRDTIPYTAGVTMVRESWTMLRAAATTSLGPKAHIRRYRQSADSVIESARMAHTRRGSFIIPIYLPLPEPEQVTDVLPAAALETAVPESQERRIMRTFAEALAAMDEIAVRPEKEPSANGVQDLIRSGVSHEFAASLRRVLAEEAVADFSASFIWAPAGGPAPRTPATVSITAAANERIQRVAERLRQVPAAQQTEYLIGPIVGVHRDDEDRSGVVTVQVSRNARPAHMNVNVSRDRLDEALDWMKARATVVVQSKVRRTSTGLMADGLDAVTTLASHQLES
ncbi:MAG: hypothetical protein H0U51_07675 [Propionibacteriales bacterium]|nr:hypothetical protein [Propionibacteriales bacterium]